MSEADMTDRHFDGDGCADLGRSDQVDLFPGHGRAYAERKRVYAEDLEEGDIWQLPGEGPLTWWHADEVVILGGDGDEVHVEYSETHPYE
jgi:hypothetical protein